MRIFCKLEKINGTTQGSRRLYHEANKGAAVGTDLEQGNDPFGRIQGRIIPLVSGLSPAPQHCEAGAAKCNQWYRDIHFEVI